MSVYLFTALCYVFLFILMCGTLCGQVCASGAKEASAPQNPVEFFTKGQKSDVLQPNGDSGKVGDVNIKDYYSPFLVPTDEFFVAVAGFNSESQPEDKINILAKYISTNKDTSLKEKIIDSSSSNSGGWKTQLAAEKVIQNVGVTCTSKGFVAVAKEKNIYLLLVNCSSKKDSNSASPDTSCTFEIFEGKGVDSTVQSDKKITWKASKSISINEKFNSQLKEHSLCGNPIFGNAFLTHNQKTIFVLKAKSTKEKNITALVRQHDIDENFEVLSVDESFDSCHPYIFPWNKSIIKLTPDCNNGKTADIKESTDMGNIWGEIKEPLSRLTGFLMDKKDFITLHTDDKELLFFTQDIKPEESPNKKENKYLWISDGNHATKVGKITANSENTAPIGLWYAKGELFLFTNNCEKGLENICLTRLEEHLTKIKKVLTAWNRNENFEKLCTDAVYSNVFCSSDRLVGFLSDTLSEKNTTWQDEYFYINATVTTGEKALNGVTFQKKNAYALWLVGKQGKDQPYNFTDSGFTLLATVLINNNDNAINNSLLGVVFNEENKHIGLLCNKNKKLAVHVDKSANFKESQKTCESGKTYSVAFVLENENLVIYVDGEKLTYSGDENTKIKKEDTIKLFYFGAASAPQELTKTNVTITNVLLYNRPFAAKEIKTLKLKKKEINTQAHSEGDGNKTPAHKNTTEETSGPETESPSSTSTTPTNTEKDGAELKLCLFYISGVTLLSLLFCPFTLLGRYVY